MVTPGSILADVGCDHGYLPIALVKQGTIKHAVALDVRKGPLKRAEEHIREQQLEAFIETRLSDGLSALYPGECDSLVIAGMGGPLIERILREGYEKLPGFRELILSPQSDIPHFRVWLYQHDFCIVDEKMLREDGKFYTIIKAAGRNTQTAEMCDDPEYVLRVYCGPVLLRRKDPVLRDYLLFRKRVCSDIKNSIGIPESETAMRRSREVDDEIKIIEKALEYYG